MSATLRCICWRCCTVVIGGVLSSTLLTLLVLPVLYVVFARRAVGSAPAEPAPEAAQHASA